VYEAGAVRPDRRYGKVLLHLCAQV
jgi:hypothetical protein